jgi:NAD(P)-dependent dehydrogenase (short-subunit alcohol dehydrogenase family)
MNNSQDTIAVVWGAGGIGIALAHQLKLRKQYHHIFLVGRTKPESLEANIQWLKGDLQDEESVISVRDALSKIGQVTMFICAVGLLHDEVVSPEKSLRQLDAGAFAHVLGVNTIGPAMLAKCFLPRMSKSERVVFAALSARVGSISDNRLGGWYAYRASKSALNMILKTLSIEWARSHPKSICVGLHPGTVDTGLSKPFQNGVSSDKLFSPDYSAACMLDVLERLEASESGRVFAYDGTEISP